MADVTAVGNVNSVSKSQPIVSEQDFAQLKPVVKQPSEKLSTSTEKKDQKPEQEQQQQQSLFAPGTVTEETVSQITEAVNDYMKQNDCNLELNYNKEANMINVKVIDKESGEVIREFPSEEMIERMIKAEENAENNQMRGIFVNRTI